MFHATPLAVPGLLLIRPDTVMDQQGWTSAVYNEAAFGGIGVHDRFIDDRIFYSDKPGNVRGLRYQLEPASQATLLRVLHGRLFVAAVDVRRGSNTFGRAATAAISYMGSEQFYAMAGFAVGWCSLDAATQVLVKTSAENRPDLMRGIAWNDPALHIDWPVTPTDAAVMIADTDQPALARQQDLL
ncbi:MAG: dTDP-4-dehydrorhamnose 3,5-epimerase family protein [Ferrovibrio sp.]